MLDGIIAHTKGNLKEKLSLLIRTLLLETRDVNKKKPAKAGFFISMYSS